MAIPKWDDPEYQHDIWSSDIVDVQPAFPSHRLGIIELIHSGRIAPGFDTMDEAWARMGRAGLRAVVAGEDGKWYCLAKATAKKYNDAVDARRAKQCGL
ncbi:MAG: hypothetical protein ACYSW3_29550 [Planctomycetota bacterium]|jgi:hypothetical protein